MGKITKTMQPRHKETLSPWLKDYVQTAASLPLPLIPQKLEEFPTRWPFPRGDLYHWIPLLNRFDSILEAFCATYELNKGFQMRDFGCDLLMNKGAPVEYCDQQGWSKERLAQLGYGEDGDCQLIVSILNFTRVLLQHCGNRSIYASSMHLNDLLNTTYLSVVYATLEVGLELAQRYQASIKRVAQPTRQVSSALLANHYNIDLDRVQVLSQPFVKTPVAPVAPRFPVDGPPQTPASASKGKEKTSGSHKPPAPVYANDLTALVAPGSPDDGRWNGWGDIKIVYYPKTDPSGTSAADASAENRPSPSTNVPATPTPLRRSSTGPSQPSQHTPRPSRTSGVDESPGSRNQEANVDEHGPKTIEIRQATVQSSSIYELLRLCPVDMPKVSRYEFLNRLRICKALFGSTEDRQLAVAVRLLAITNLAYIHSENTFAEKVLKQDNDEPRRYQLVYQLAELIHPSVAGAPETPLWLQAIAFAALEAISVVPAKYADVLSALNANVNHGVLLYVIRKAVASMREDPVEADEGKVTDADHWRGSLFALTLHMAMSSRIGQEMASAGLLDILVEILNIRSKTATRNYSMVLAFLDTLVYTYQGAFSNFSSAGGLDAISRLIVDTVAQSRDLVAQGLGTKPEFHAQLVDYEIPFYHQQTLKWLLKFIHHIMTNAFSFGANTDRLLRNLVDNSSLLRSLRVIIENTRVFGSVVWTNAASLLSDFLNNDPTSFAAISESGLIQSFLSTLTGREVTLPKPPGSPKPEQEGEDVSSPDYSDDSITFEPDTRPHPPTAEMLEEPRENLAQGILASSDAINVIPPILNSISLNNQGMKMVVASNALESYLEIFESPDHVQVMSLVDPDLAGVVGSSFDELARHHPKLRPSISNAVIDMVARVLHIAKTKAAAAGWGAKLLVVDPTGQKVTADESLLANLEGVTKGKGKATPDDMDVDMVDVIPPGPSTPTGGDAEGESGLEKPIGAHHEITPYILALAQFLGSIVTNSSLRSTFVQDGGIELLLELSEAPSLPEDFDNTQASRTLSQVIAQLIESSPVLGIPSLLNRIHAAIDDLQPLVSKERSQSFFAPFIVPGSSLVNTQGEWDATQVRKVASGTRVVKALVKLQTLVKTLYQSFPYASRQGMVTMPAVNAYDLFRSLIRRLGPLLHGIITEEMAIAALVPQHWTGTKPVTQDGTELPAPPVASSGIGDESKDDSNITDTISNKKPAAATEPKKPTQEERSTVQFQNYFVIHQLLHSLTPSTLPFFQTIGKTLLLKRATDRDNHLRSYHLSIADALAETVLEQLKTSQDQLTARDLHYWIVMFHTLREMLIEPPRHGDRSVNAQLILPVLVALKERGGLEMLNAMLQKFSDEIRNGNPDGDDAHKVRLATVGMKKILEIYHLIANGKNVNDSLSQTSLYPRNMHRDRDYGHQLVVELRYAILPVVRKLWESDIAEKAPTPVLSKIIDILKTIAAGDQELSAWRKSDKISPQPIFKNREPLRFPWATHSNTIKSLTEHFDEDLVREAVYRANGKVDDASEYCRAHSKGIAGKRNPIPKEDEYQRTSSPKPQQPRKHLDAEEEQQLRATADAMQFLRDMGEHVFGESSDHSSDESHDHSSHDIGAEDSPIPVQEASSRATTKMETDSGPSSAAAADSRPAWVTKEDLDEERTKLQKDLIERCLDVVRAHPDSVFEISDLVDITLLRSDNEEKRTEVGEILANALMSFAMNDDVERRENGQGISAYAHLLSLLLQNRPFFESTLPTLKQNIEDYLGFLKVSPASSNEELPSWLPYILLIFEILLSDDQQPVEVHWKPPVTDDEPLEQPVWKVKEPSVSDEHRSALLRAILDILPRVGKEESLAISVLRILVILTRDHAMAKIVGEKRNLQRLFVMAKQSCSGGSARLNQTHISDNIMIILRHIVEDEDVVRQIMQTEIRQFLSSAQRNPRSYDVYSYLRHLSHVALRSPKLFVEVTNDLVKLSRWVSLDTGISRGHHSLALKEQPAENPEPPKDGSVEPAVQATEDLTIEDVKPTTESADKEMPDAPKGPFEIKRPVLENPDGVIHFLLCELLNYREVDDKELPVPTSKDQRAEGEPSSAGGDTVSTSSDDQPSESKEKDKKSLKPVFKAEEHPIFVYRCFLLNCLAELLQNYNRCKVEFINFKRSAPMQTNTPIKPRSSILNYLLNDLLCLGPAGIPLDSTAIKKKAATSNHAQAVLCALVARTPEKPIDRSRDHYEYDDDPDLLFVRRFVLDTILRAYKEASQPGEPIEIRYGKMMCAAELMSLMIGEKDRDAQPRDNRGTDPVIVRSQMQLKRLMYEKGYIAALTSSIADIDLTFPNVKRTIKYILRVLRSLTKTAYHLSQLDIIPATVTDQPEDDFLSSSSLSDLDDDREETPDLYRNSTLGMLEPGREEDFSDEDEDDEDAMYDDEAYDDELDYGDEMSQDEEENPSDDDEEELDEMGEIEGLPGDPGVVEVIMGENDDDVDEDMEEEDEEPSEEDEGDEDDEMGSDDMEDVEEQVEIVDEEGNPIDDDGASGWESATDEEGEEGDEDLEYEGEGQDMHDAVHGHGMDRIPDILRTVVDGEDLDGEDIDDHYIDDGGEDDEEEDEDDMEDDEVYYDQGHHHDDYPPPNMPSGLGWDIAVEPGHRVRHGGVRSPFPSGPLIMGHSGHDFRHFFGPSHHSRLIRAPGDDGTNPLLLSSSRHAQDQITRASQQQLIRLGFPPHAFGGPGMDGPLAIINDLMQTIPLSARAGAGIPVSLQLRSEGPSGEIRHLNIPLGNMAQATRDTRREVYQEPHQAVAFIPQSTAERWQEEAKIIFTSNHIDKSRVLANFILGMLMPAAIKEEKEAKAREEEERRKREEERKKREEEERKERERKEAEERAAREKKEAEERERRERERAEAEAARATGQEGAAEEPQAMEGVESTTTQAEQAQPSAPRPRVLTTIRGETVDVTDLGIDPDYLAALPEEFREEVIAQTVSARRSEARQQAADNGENTEVFQEFLDALPAELRMEIEQQERQERRRREREEQRRQAAAAGQSLGPSDMDAASILLTFPPALREQVLLEQGEEILDQLPPDLAAEARALAQRHGLHRAAVQAARAQNAGRQPQATEPKPQRRTIVQMLDKSGIATLLRLMFVAQQGSIRNYLFDVFAHVCENRQNRLEVISTLLQILQDGSTDMDAVERSFGQLSLKAKQPKDNKDTKTPQSLKRTFTSISTSNQTTGSSEVSPLLVVQQCLDLLSELATKNPHIPSLFLTEHESVATTLKRSLSRKGKGKDVSSKAHKFAINSLLGLLDRNLVMESSSVMQLLADLLNKVTYPLQALERRRKEAEEEAKKKAGKANEEERAAAGESAETSNTQASTTTEQPSGQTGEQQAEGVVKDKESEQKQDEKKVRQLIPPTIPDHNLKLVIKIFVARECSSKTFQNTISTIKNLSSIPGAKKVFGEELVVQAKALSENIVQDLDDLLPHILKAESGTEIQGIALAKFSPGASEQNKLLRVLTALDHLFDNKKSNGESSPSSPASPAEGKEIKESTKDELLGSLYHNETFNVMWDKLSACLSAIRQRENMINVATILLPLIESLMVVCKNTVLKETAASQASSQTVLGKNMPLSTPPPEDRMASLFFTFTEEHRRILNELVRQNPKLMSGTFSLLVKNPKVLEFDNKRNYFNRSVHAKSRDQQRQQYPTLQLSVRRDHVFHDSFKSLYFKSGPEMKYGKLNIRFHGEEGVDAGGVTREWFQVLARQMFDPNYALFEPVSADRTTFHPNKLSGINPEHLLFFKFIGRIIGKALYEGRLLDCYFSRAVYKRILGKPVSVKDMESFDPEYYKSLIWMLENDITDVITETFSIEDEEFGVKKVVDLIENGRNIPVTEENKHEYVRLIVEHKLLTSVKEQMEHFLKGFHDIIPADLISIFNEQELELLISGLPDIDIDDWKSNTEYHNYTAASPQIQWFWRAVRSFDKEEQAKLLQFVTGTSKVPLNGFKELEGMNGVNRFNIHRDYGSKDRLPSSHTCFNQLDLPEYDSYETLRSQLLKAITAGSDYFGFA